MWRSKLPFCVKEAPHWLHWKGRSPEGKNTTDTSHCKEANDKRKTNHRKKFNLYILLAPSLMSCVHVFGFSFLFYCTTLPNLSLFDLSTYNNNCTKSFLWGWKGCCCGNAGSLHYKHPMRQNKPYDRERLRGREWSSSLWEGFTAEWHTISPCSPCPTDFWHSDRTRAFQTQPASSVMHHCLGQFDLKISFFPLLRL